MKLPKREIKFRAWDKKKKRMTVVDSINFEHKTIMGEFYADGSDWGAGLEHPLEDLILMQFTGLKDRNEKEIYEGDVVLVPDDYTEPITEDGRGPADFSPHLSLVVFSDGCFKFRIFDDADMLHRGYFSYKDIEECVGVDDLEVVGNIFENSELLD